MEFDTKKGHEKTCLFRVTKGPLIFHLLGTQQNITLEMLPLEIQKIIAQAQTIFTEHFAEDPVTDLMRAIKKYHGFSYKNEYANFDHPSREIIEAALAPSSGEWLLGQIKNVKLKPWVIYGFYFLHTAIMQGMNEQIITQAKKKKHLIFGLESTSYRIRTYGLPTLDLKQCQEKIIALSLILKNKRATEATTTEDYLRADLIKFYERENPLTPMRNRNFLKNLLKFLTPKLPSSLVELDVTHLPGETGLLQLLKAHGFSVQQYNATGIASAYNETAEIAKVPSNANTALLFSKDKLLKSEGIFDHLGDSKQNKEITEQAKGKILEYLNKNQCELGQAIGKGDCFFDAIGQGLVRQHISIPTEYSGESPCKKLRLISAVYAAKHQNTQHHWLKAKFKEEKEYENYLLMVGFTAAEVNALWQQHQLPAGVALWGRSDLDGRIISEVLNIRLHIIEIVVIEQQVVLAHQLVDANGSKPIVAEKEISALYNDTRIIHLAVYQHSLHFVPVLSKEIKLENKAAEKPTQLK